MALGIKALPLIALLALAGHCPSVEASTGSSRTPASQSQTRTPAGTSEKSLEYRYPNPGYMPQADAFDTASEQAVFMAAYQMWYGPYGREQNPEEREKTVRETAEAIDNCINGRRCDEEKVLKALVQYNMGQEVKRMMVTNSTNREKMRSLDAPDRQKLDDAMKKGVEFEYKATPVAQKVGDETEFHKSRKVADIRRGRGSGKEAFFQLDENMVRPTDYSEREILGDEFFREFGVFMKDSEAAKRHRARFYKIVPANETYVFAESNGEPVIDDAAKARMSELQAEQSHSSVEKTLEEYRRNLRPMQEEIDSDGRRNLVLGPGDSKLGTLGLGEIAQVDPSRHQGINFKDIAPNGEFDRNTNARAAARVINAEIRRVAQEKMKPAEGRSLTSGDAPAGPTHVSVTLSPDAFSNFLEEIWPSAAKRREILSQRPREPAQAPEAQPEREERLPRPRPRGPSSVRPTPHNLPDHGLVRPTPNIQNRN